MSGKVLLSFDVEEFDLPKEHGAEISLEEGIAFSKSGLERILEVLDDTDVRATFFCTGNFARQEPEILRQMQKAGHEIACHGVDHFEPKETDVRESKKIIEKVIKSGVQGYRQPRMQKIDYGEMKKYGYVYDSSVNPAFIPGRYNHLNTPRKPFFKSGIVEIPTSVATFMRVPLFWLALHLFPERLYFWFVKMSLKKTGYFTTYFHPWEFGELGKFKRVPGYIKKNSGKKLVARLRRLILKLQKNGCEFCTYGEFVKDL